MSITSSDDNSNMNGGAAPYKLLEINMISAQELAQVSKSVRAYAVAWLHQDRKLGTQVDEDGHTNPTWNEKFVFRVDEHIHTNSVITIEIYSQSHLRHVLIGTVTVLLSDLLPPNRKRKPRFVALQIRSPSGRPQGILNIGVNLLDPTLRSMPLYSELSSSDANYSENNTTNTKTHDSSVFTLQRCQSEKNDSTVNDYAYDGNNKHYDYNGESDSDMQKDGVFNEGSLISDVGPSPSIVAAAIAKGLYPMPPPRTVETSTMDGWSETTGNEVIKNKCEKWRNELTPAYEDSYPKKMRQTPKRTYDDSYTSDDRRNKRKTPRRVSQTRDRRGGPISCFGSVFGLEVTISCGGGNHSKSKRRGTAASSELTFDDSYI